jgi:hypothetical protein
MESGDLGRREDTRTVKDGIDFLFEGDLGGRVDVFDEGERRVEGCFRGGWGCVLEFDIIVLTWRHDDAAGEELMSET